VPARGRCKSMCGNDLIGDVSGTYCSGRPDMGRGVAISAGRNLATQSGSLAPNEEL